MDSNGHCTTCSIEQDCAYEHKPCDCAQHRKFKPLPKAPIDKNAPELEAVRNVLFELRTRIVADKITFNNCGRNTKGHARAIILLKELREEIDTGKFNIGIEALYEKNIS